MPSLLLDLDNSFKGKVDDRNEHYNDSQDHWDKSILVSNWVRARDLKWPFHYLLLWLMLFVCTSKREILQNRNDTHHTGSIYFLPILCYYLLNMFEVSRDFYPGSPEDYVSARSPHNPTAYRDEMCVSVIVNHLEVPEAHLQAVRAAVRAVVEPYNEVVDTLEEKITKDGLTGILNHSAFFASVTKSVAPRDRWEDRLTTNFLVLLDGDGFSLLNELLGHHGGNAVIQETARTLGECTRATDKVGRLGGDEFAVLIAGISRDDLAGAISHINGGVSQIRVGAMKDPLTVSIGIVELPQGSSQKDVDDAYKNADLALYHSKKTGRDRATLINPHEQDIFETIETN